MGIKAQFLAGGLLVLTLSACTGDIQAAPGTVADAGAGPVAGPAAGTATPSAETGSDVGNGRPAVSHDGLMVRRRAVIAVHPTPEADLGSVRTALDRAAAGSGTVLYGIAPDVLDPAVLDHLVPELIVALPPDAVREDAEHLAQRAFGPEGSHPGVEHVHVASVLVHDLRFTLASADPDALIESITAEGILSDALGNYATSSGDGAVAVSYTGPLLSDALVEAVRTGMARSAGVSSDEVTVMPLSPAGEGVDLSKEPDPSSEQQGGAGPAGDEDPGHDDGLTHDEVH